MSEEQAVGAKARSFTFYLDQDNKDWLNEQPSSKRSRLINRALRSWRQRDKVLELVKYIFQFEQSPQ